MSDHLNEILARHREIWFERMVWCCVLAACAGVVVGYLVRAWAG